MHSLESLAEDRSDKAFLNLDKLDDSSKSSISLDNRSDLLAEVRSPIFTVPQVKIKLNGLKERSVNEDKISDSFSSNPYADIGQVLSDSKVKKY